MQIKNFCMKCDKWRCYAAGGGYKISQNSNKPVTKGREKNKFGNQ